MNYWVNLTDPKQRANILAALRIVDADAELSTVPADWNLTVAWDAEYVVRITLETPGVIETWQSNDPSIHDRRWRGNDLQLRLKELIRLGVIRLMDRFLDKPVPWGILSGVRPTKIFHFLRDRGFSIPEIREQLLGIYGLDPVKTDLVLEVGARQEPFFKPESTVGIYIGIPFCPTRCHYCSFPAVPLSTHGHLVANFLAGLKIEAQAISELCQEMGLQVESVYVGGGTPTSLDEATFSEIIQTIVRNFVDDSIVEFTVEAGRPETLSPIKLQTMLNAGVSRISINPQTMNQSTLDRIGRRHTVADVYNAVASVKTTQLILNMDLIAGLPGESGADFGDSLQKVIDLEPQNITVHTLAPKRAAAWRNDFSALDLLAASELSIALENGRTLLRGNGYVPYYLYRQRHILADQENTGYGTLGTESIYNIQMMEERQTIFGLGAGAVTKWVTGHRVIRHQNPKCPATYYHRIQDELVKKAQQTRLLLG
ncbi:oxygen-independent coproporphyrinogen-3 oxidase [Hydrogenispora ethanolica]|jgi:oxygen-independent coproporphyrinogen-3 oxidase|uniref:Oxygen-independent coproporphyrinogen-3 oxidase n=1 Tax=Hydrogenispora ethanolica TaxID=1082276 RepID=A0A4R1RSH2_HYDET|nr:coproporphyrinogen dehydrogenase HemZ [Hydrogenispora ethanolica]TCL69316.1 oxygen-independent coproporphyrinogen-3 oxidase [Hydrogenispora ethanolica]